MARRFKVRDSKSNINITASSHKIDLGTDFISTGDITVACWVQNKGGIAGTNTIIDNGKLVIYAAATTRAITVFSGTGGPARSANNPYPFFRWAFVCVTRKEDGTTNIYINGVLSGTADQSSGTVEDGTTNVYIGNRQAVDRDFRGSFDNFRIFNKILSVKEIQDLYYDDTVPTRDPSVLALEYLFDEGSGPSSNTTVYDTSGNLKHATLTGTNYLYDSPFYPRKEINPNLIKNGAIDWIPPFTAAGTTSARWMDGSAAGSTTNDLFGWAQVIDSASASCQFDSANSKVGKYSLRVDTLDASGRARICQGGGSGGTAGSIAIATLKKYGIPVKPSTSYTFGAWVKYTNVLTGNCNFQIDEMDGTGTRVASSNNAFGSGTSDWVYKTLTFTTSATTQFLVLALGFNSAGEVKTAWFDDISLYQTTPITRTTNTRNRLGVRNGLYSMLFNGSSTELTRSAINNAGTKWATEFWFNVNTVAVRSNFVYRGNGDGNYPRVYTSGTGTSTRVAIQYAMQGQASQSFSATTPIVPYKWYHVIATIDNDIGVTALYINGVLEASQTPNGGIGTVISSGSSGLAIGHDGNIPLWMNGKISLFRLWKGMSLSAEDAQDLYLSGTVPVTKPPTVEYLFNEGSGATATDTSGNGLNSTIANGTFINDRPFSARTNV